MDKIYAPVMRVLVVAALALATATLMVVAVNTARASGVSSDIRSIAKTSDDALSNAATAI